MSLLTYDAPPQYRRTPLGLLVPERPRPVRLGPISIDLFAGAGGFGWGFHSAGFHVVAAMDNWEPAALTYLVNLGRPARFGGVRMHYDTPESEERFTRAVERHLGLSKKEKTKRGRLTLPDQAENFGQPRLAGGGAISHQPEEAQRRGCAHYFFGDVRNFTGQQILDAIGLESNDITAVTGGPPCQGFSAAGKRQVMDPRNSLVFEFVRLVCEIRPLTFVMENVPGMESMVTPEGVPVLDALCVALEGGGYGDYDALRKALATTGGKTGTRNSRRTKRPTRKAVRAAKAAIEPAPDLLSELDALAPTTPGDQT